MKRINVKRFAAISATLLTLAAFSGCERIKEAYGIGENEGEAVVEAPVPEAPIYAVNTMTTAAGTIADYLALSGDVVAASTIDAYSDAAGKISKLNVSVGSRVNRGDPIAEVDPSRPGMEYVASVVRAPVSGTIVALPAQMGMTVSQAVPLARIAGGSGLEIRLYVAERFISRIALRQSCEITLDAWPGEVFQGRVSEISPVVDPSSRTMEVRVVVSNAGTRLKAGMFAKVRIITEQKNNIVKIPSSALIQRFGEEYIFVTQADPANADGFVAEKRIVVPGILIDGVLEVQSGLAPGEDVIIRGQTFLENGSRVNVVDRSAAIGAN